jgi:hypothetical protein
MDCLGDVIPLATTGFIACSQPIALAVKNIQVALVELSCRHWCKCVVTQTRWTPVVSESFSDINLLETRYQTGNIANKIPWLI